MCARLSGSLERVGIKHNWIVIGFVVRSEPKPLEGSLNRTTTLNSGRRQNELSSEEELT